MSTSKSSVAVLALVSVLGMLSGAVAGPVKPPAKPADISIDVSPRPARAGGGARVSVQLRPIEGVKINRYPKMQLRIDERPGLVAGPAEAAVGNATPPSPEQMGKNYFETIDPLELELQVDPAAAPGLYQVEGRLKYFYCVTASGFCAPHRTTITIPLEVR